MPYTPTTWSYWLGLDGYYVGPRYEVIGRALSDRTWEPAAGTPFHDALADLGVSSAQNIRDIGSAGLEVRWYAWWVENRIEWTGDPTHASCASIIDGANAVLTAPTP